MRRKSLRVSRAHTLLAAGAGVAAVTFTGAFMSGCGGASGCEARAPDGAIIDTCATSDATTDGTTDATTDASSDAKSDASDAGDAGDARSDAALDAATDASTDGPTDAPASG